MTKASLELADFMRLVLDALEATNAARLDLTTVWREVQRRAADRPE